MRASTQCSSPVSAQLSCRLSHSHSRLKRNRGTAGESEEFAHDISEAATVTWGLRVVDDYDIMHVAAWEPAGGEREELGRSEEGGKDEVPELWCLPLKGPH